MNASPEKSARVADGKTGHVAKAPQRAAETPPTAAGVLEHRLEEMFRQVRPRLLTIAERVLGDADEAEDAVQDALVKAWQKLDRFEGRSSLTTWLHRITVNTALDHLRRRASAVGGMPRNSAAGVVSPERPGPEPGDAAVFGARHPDTPERLFQRAESSAVVHRAIDRLSPAHADVLRLCELEEQSYATTASLVRCPLGTVMSRLYHARRSFAREVGAAAASEEDFEALCAA